MTDKLVALFLRHKIVLVTRVTVASYYSISGTLHHHNSMSALVSCWVVVNPYSLLNQNYGPGWHERLKDCQTNHAKMLKLHCTEHRCCLWKRNEPSRARVTFCVALNSVPSLMVQWGSFDRLQFPSQPIKPATVTWFILALSRSDFYIRHQVYRNDPACKQWTRAPNKTRFQILYVHNSCFRSYFCSSWASLCRCI